MMKMLRTVFAMLVICGSMAAANGAVGGKTAEAVPAMALNNTAAAVEDAAPAEVKKEQLPVKTIKAAKRIAFTFDDGPTKYTAKLLDGLKEREIKASFFPIGYMAKKRPEMVIRMRDEGHTIGSHTYYHRRLTALGTEDMLSEIGSVNEYFSALLNKKPSLLRPPYGEYNEQTLKNAGGPIILWSVDPQDWKVKSAQKIKNEIVKNAFDGAIVLCHDTHQYSVSGALSAMDALRQKGYEIVTLDELLFWDKQPCSDTVYYKG